jgi:hypothetical protein
MRASAEVQAWIQSLRADEATLGQRSRRLRIALGVGLGLLALVGATVYWSLVGRYAVVDEVAMNRHPASQGRLQFRLNVVRPGKVHYRRTSGPAQTDLVDRFTEPGRIDRAWAWTYQPGKPIEATVWYRRGLLLRSRRASFPTSARADIVILIDTTGSMDRSLAELQEKCVRFSQRLTEQSLEHRFALIGFGDRSEGRWIEVTDFTADAEQFRRAVQGIERFDGGDLPESALGALRRAMELPLAEGAIRRFYLVTDAPYHEPGAGGITAAEIAAQLEAGDVLLHVFSRRAFEDDYRKLLGEAGKFLDIENFGRALDEGRILED